MDAMAPFRQAQDAKVVRDVSLGVSALALATMFGAPIAKWSGALTKQSYDWIQGGAIFTLYNSLFIAFIAHCYRIVLLNGQ